MQYPSERHWQLWGHYQVCPPPLHPLQFLQEWDLSYPDLAKLIGVSRSTIEHWFSTGAGHREPPSHHCRRLAEIHLLWSLSPQLTPDQIHLWCRSESSNGH